LEMVLKLLILSLSLSLSLSHTHTHTHIQEDKGLGDGGEVSDSHSLSLSILRCEGLEDRGEVSDSLSLSLARSLSLSHTHTPEDKGLGDGGEVTDPLSVVIARRWRDVRVRWLGFVPGFVSCLVAVPNPKTLERSTTYKARAPPSLPSLSAYHSSKGARGTAGET